MQRQPRIDKASNRTNIKASGKVKLLFKTKVRFSFPCISFHNKTKVQTSLTVCSSDMGLTHRSLLVCEPNLPLLGPQPSVSGMLKGLAHLR